MSDNIRQQHVSPGIYSKETELSVAVNSLGITTLGAVGETLKGPAFQPMLIENWSEFQDVFGGTSTEKYKGSKYPKYELPYIAKSFLSQSKQMQVCRVLGLSGYNAGPAWVITFSPSGDTSTKYALAVLRSRGSYKAYVKYSNNGTTNCNCPQQEYDKLVYRVGEKGGTYDCESAKSYNMKSVKLSAYQSLSYDGNECDGYAYSSSTNTFSISPTDLGRFTIECIDGEFSGTSFSSTTEGYKKYPVSLNPTDKDYILKVLGTRAEAGDAPIYVESLYDVALEQLADEGDYVINQVLEEYQVYNAADWTEYEPVNDFIIKDEHQLTRKDVGKRFLAGLEAKTLSNGSSVQAIAYDYKTNKEILDASGNSQAKDVEVGRIYTVAQKINAQGKRVYFYKYFADATDSSYKNIDKLVKDQEKQAIVKNNADGFYYRLNSNSSDVVKVSCDLNDYRSAYRFASTPWFVSNLMGDGNKIEMTKMFRFHTISDGDMSNNEVKISIQNIKPDEGTFDVLVRSINDTDEMQNVLERYTKCTMTPKDSNYIAYKIGSYDGVYETKSKYITVEVNENDVVRNCVPCGFIGYPTNRFNGYQVVGDNKSVQTPPLKYNLNYDEDKKNRKQYFGLSDIIGVDVDAFLFKGASVYDEDPNGLTHGFHLDSRLAMENISISVDGESGYVFDYVSPNNTTRVYDGAPIIATEDEMYGSIYEYVDLRKFTAYFYGGFDGWDVYRDERSNSDDFKLSKYNGKYNKKTGEGYAFQKIESPEILGLNQDGITSDWYAYLSAIRQFSNPESVDINVFCTPGIDYVNNQLLVEETIEMIEEERADSIYVVTTPDKPKGADDYVSEMYTPSDVVMNLEDTEIDSNYTCTYYPWVKYLDTANNQYIYLPATKDVVRNMAQTDNTAWPWFAPAGIERGSVDCVRAKYITKLADEDTLYEGRINPIKTFAQDGVKVWGQKNLQVGEAVMNRINTRRLLLRVRKLISIACRGLVFDQNDTTIKSKFLSIVNPIMDSVKSNRGISEYRIDVDDSVEMRERREISARLMMKPYNALEYITLNFTVTKESVSFDDI